MKRRVLSIVVTLAMVLTLLPGAARAADTVGTGKISGKNVTPTEFLAAADADNKITLTGDVILTERVDIDDGRTITVDLATYTLSCSKETAVPQIFYVTKGKLILEGTTGEIKGSNMLIYVMGTENDAELVLNGANITQKSQNSDNSAVFLWGRKCTAEIRSGTITGVAHSDPLKKCCRSQCERQQHLESQRWKNHNWLC